MKSNEVAVFKNGTIILFLAKPASQPASQPASRANQEQHKEPASQAAKQGAQPANVSTHPHGITILTYLASLAVYYALRTGLWLLAS